MKPKPSLTSSHIVPGMVVTIDDAIYRVESAVKVTAAKGSPFIKAKLRDMVSDEVIEKSFKEGQAIKEVSLEERSLEFLYIEDGDYLFLDIGNLEKVLVPKQVIGDKVNYIKEGIEVKAILYGDKIFSVELPQFLELMIVKTDHVEQGAQMANTTKLAALETGAEVQVPLFVATGDIIKVDTMSHQYIQRV